MSVIFAAFAEVESVKLLHPDRPAQTLAITLTDGTMIHLHVQSPERLIDLAVAALAAAEAELDAEADERAETLELPPPVLRIDGNDDDMDIDLNDVPW